ncbi:CBS domain-containing protein [Aquibacillus rhizosphaerae]|uniref:CBS domain-containing protein n=1 Tax=Aquibacillus rhizosphaerae TaxID=3051431 RepID=A0ABT7L4J5_9BACI|nr:CBS domain-containing protein [Aquibacillus sp. LR5S19]MDL4840774.1 CBS domain-containing protein [Aquibacillus sp. LR5S19]
MFVRSTMKPSYQCFVASPTDTLRSVIEVMEKENFQAMPVVDNNLFKGMVSKQSIFRAFFYSNQSQDEFLDSRKVNEITTNHDLFIGEDEVFERTFTTFKDYPILAVADANRKFLGIVSRFDVLEQFESAFGTKRKGIRIAFTSEESSGRFSRLSDIMKQFHVNIISITTFDETDKLARRIVLKIDQGVKIDKLAKKLENSGFRVLDIKEEG